MVQIFRSLWSPISLSPHRYLASSTYEKVESKMWISEAPSLISFHSRSGTTYIYLESAPQTLSEHTPQGWIDSGTWLSLVEFQCICRISKYIVRHPFSETLKVCSEWCNLIENDKIWPRELYRIQVGLKRQTSTWKNNKIKRIILQ